MRFQGVRMFQEFRCQAGIGIRGVDRERVFHDNLLFRNHFIKGDLGTDANLSRLAFKSGLKL